MLPHSRLSVNLNNGSEFTRFSNLIVDVMSLKLTLCCVYMAMLLSTVIHTSQYRSPPNKVSAKDK